LHFETLARSKKNLINYFARVFMSRKAGTRVLTFATAYYCLFHVDYGEREHCFSGIQRWYSNKLDSMLGIEKKNLNQIAEERDGKSSS
jgi:hypothetical protein